MPVRLLLGMLMLTFGSRAFAQPDSSSGSRARSGAAARARGSSALRDTGEINFDWSRSAGELLSATARQRLLDTLAAHRRLWEQRRPRGYIIRTLRISECLDVRTRPIVRGELLRPLLVVRDTTVRRRELAPIPATYAEACELEWRVDDLFAAVRLALGDSSADVTGIEYDPAYGFPRAYWITHGYAPGAHVLVESFAAAP